MHVIDKLSNPNGLCVLSGSGDISFFGADRALQRDAVLTEVLGEHIREFLHQYLKQPDGEGWRVAILYESAQARPWGNVILRLDEAVVRQLYPVGGRTSGALTAFQQKNREKSIYQGMELLLDYRVNAAATTPTFFPVLFDRHGTLAQYGELPAGEDGTRPALELLNLAAGLSPARREYAALVTLHGKIHDVVVRKDRRHGAEYGLLDRLRDNWDEKATEADAYTDADKRFEREVTISDKDLEQLHVLQRNELVERWLEVPYRPVDAARLQQFVHFRDMDPTKLSFLARRALVYTAPANERLLERNSTDRWNLYLLEGSLMLEPEDGAALIIEGNTDKAATPIAFLKPRKYMVSTVTRTSFLWIHDILLDVLRKSGRLEPKKPTEDEKRKETADDIRRMRAQQQVTKDKPQ